MITSYIRRAARSAAGAAVEWVMKRFGGGQPAPRVERIRREPERQPVGSPAIAEAVPEVEVRPETRGSGRDARSFEQRRRGGPVTGEGPSKIRGPRHTGGGKRRGRDDAGDAADALFPDLPIMDYDELPADTIEMRIRSLNANEVRAILDYETRNKHRKSVLDALTRRLAA